MDSGYETLKERFEKAAIEPDPSWVKTITDRKSLIAGVYGYVNAHYWNTYREKTSFNPGIIAPTEYFFLLPDDLTIFELRHQGNSEQFSYFVALQRFDTDPDPFLEFSVYQPMSDPENNDLPLGQYSAAQLQVLDYGIRKPVNLTPEAYKVYQGIARR